MVCELMSSMIVFFFPKENTFKKNVKENEKKYYKIKTNMKKKKKRKNAKSKQLIKISKKREAMKKSILRVP